MPLINQLTNHFVIQLKIEIHDFCGFAKWTKSRFLRRLRSHLNGSSIKERVRSDVFRIGFFCPNDLLHSPYIIQSLLLLRYYYYYGSYYFILFILRVSQFKLLFNFSMLKVKDMLIADFTWFFSNLLLYIKFQSNLRNVSNINFAIVHTFERL